MPYLRVQRTQILTLQTWGGKLLKKKIKNGYSTLLNKQQLKKYKENIYVFVSTIKKIKFQIDTGSDLTIINAENWKKTKYPILSN